MLLILNRNNSGMRLYWLLRTSIRKIDNLVFHHPSIYLCHVVLSRCCGRARVLMHERRREKNALICSIHPGKPCQGCMRGLPKAPLYMKLLAGCPRPPAVLTNTLYRFKLPIGSLGGAHPLSDQ